MSNSNDNKMSNNILIDEIYKDATPTKTVERIKEILASHGIKTVENWIESGVEYCYSLRLNVDGAMFGVNGKGLTREFALASAYGELMERMQLGLFGDSSVQKLGHYDAAIGNDRDLSAEQLYKELPDWYDYLAKRLNELDGTKIEGKELLASFADGEGKLKSTAFYNLMNGKTVHVPREIRCLSCGSNGGAAGNTMEEAIVQAISEIMERHYKQRIVSEGISLPDVPEERLKACHTAYKIISSLREKGLEVMVKDCSLGTKYPVVCVCYINKKTGKYHTHFGAYPVFEIALERTLTETFQGRQFDKFPKNEDFVYKFEDVHTYRSIYKELKKGNYDKTPEFFIGECKYPYNEDVGFSGKNNVELLKELVEYFAATGKEILVRNASSLGFPTYNVLIPGYSEVIIHSLSKKQSGFVNAKAAAKTLKNLAMSSYNDYFMLLKHISEMKKLSSLDERLFSFGTCANLPIKCDKNEDQYLLASSLAYVYYGIGNFAQALGFAEKMIPVAKQEDIGYLVCIKRYLSMLLNGDDETKIKRLIEMFHEEDVVKAVYSHLASGTNIFDKFVLRCDEKSCQDCIANSWCKQKYTKSLIEIVHEGAKKLNFDEFIEEISNYKKV